MTTVRRRRTRSVVVAVLALAAVLLGGTQVAQAAQLSMSGAARAYTGAYTGRCDTQLTATPGSAKVTISDINTTATTSLQSCTEKTAQVWVRSASGVATTGSATVSGSTLVVSLGTTTPTTAYSIVVMIGGWPVSTTWAGATVGCQVVDGQGNPTGASCTITDLHVGDSWGTVGSRVANFYVSFSATGVNGDNRVQFTADLSTATGLPSGWTWSTSGTATGTNITPVAGYTCSQLPILTAQTSPGWGSYTGVYFAVYENRSGQTVSCS